MPEATLERLMRKVVWNGDEAECWEWQAALSEGGYGCCNVEGKHRKAHRAIYELLVGVVPRKLDLDHLCRNRACVNPAHLEPVTRAENLRRGRHPESEKTHCKHGHPFNEKNTRWKDGGGRECRKCNALRSKEFRLANPDLCRERVKESMRRASERAP